MDILRQERIQRRAHEIWEREGRPEGGHEEHWRQAEQEIAAEDAAHDGASAAEPAEGSADIAPDIALSAAAAGMREAGRPVSAGGSARGHKAKARRKDAVPPPDGTGG